MLTKITLKSEREALDYLSKLSALGYDVFRGQRKDWPIRPSFFRSVDIGKELANARIKAFLSWCSGIWRLSQYKNEQLIAIAQHYGIPTVLVDVTRSFETALFFANDGAALDKSFRPTVYAWKRGALRKLAGIELVEQRVPDLWRLEAQDGFFLQFHGDIILDLAAAETCQIEFPGGPVTPQLLARGAVYPIRKSRLEIVLDEYFHKHFRDQISDQLKELTFKDPRFIRVQPFYACRSYLLAFDQSRPHSRPSFGTTITQDWMESRSAPYSSVQAGRQRVFDLGDKRLDPYSQITEALIYFESALGHPMFLVGIFKVAEIDCELSRIFNWLFDGLVAFPYSRLNRIKSLTNSFHLLHALRGSETLSHAQRQIDDILGENCLVHFAPENGLHRRAFASIRSLERAVDPDAVRSLKPFFRRQIVDRKREITCFRVQPAFNFDFSRFVSLFVEEIVPSQVLEYAQLCHSRSWRIAVPWNIVFDPMSITYFTVADYFHKYPFAYEQKIDEVLYLFRGMDADDVEDEIASLAVALGTKDSAFALRIHGFADDSRELWEIEDAVYLLKAFLQKGGIRLLTFSTTIKGKGAAKESVSDALGSAPGLGAFEVWLVVHRRWKIFFNNPDENWVAFLSLFYSDLIACDDALKSLIGRSKRRGRRARFR